MDQGYEETSVYLKVNEPAFSAMTLTYCFFFELKVVSSVCLEFEKGNLPVLFFPMFIYSFSCQYCA